MDSGRVGRSYGGHLSIWIVLAPLILPASACLVTLDKPAAGPCGDGVLAGEEACDDGNTTDGDGCSETCTVEPGWSCQGAPSTCGTTCGDGIAAGSEPCDHEDLAGSTCESEGYADGVLACGGGCTLEFTGCVACGDGDCDTAYGEGAESCPEDCGFSQLSVGEHIACALRRDGTIWCWGNNGNGQLGSGSLEPYSDTPEQVADLGGGLGVEVAGLHACAVAEAGSDGATGVFCWGRNHLKQLGSTLTHDHPTPVQVSGLDATALQVDVAWTHSCARLADGTVRCWGDADDLRLGNCSTSGIGSTSVPVLVEGVAGAEHISADAGSTCALLDTGVLMCWGENSGGAVGNGTTDATCTPNSVDALPPVASFVMGDHYIFAIEPDGTAWSWGDNTWGQLGDATDVDHLIPALATGTAALRRVGLGWFHTCGVYLDGSSGCWGRNHMGQLGRGTTSTEFELAAPVVGLVGEVLDVQAGYSHSCALLVSGSIWCWGDNSHGQLGNGSDQQSWLPQRVLVP